MKRGAFIVLEGCDRCGKTTQAKLLVDYLSKLGRNVQGMGFPDRSTKIGEIINQFLKKETPVEDHAIHLLFSANRWELKSKMSKLLNGGTTLIVDRYSYSGVAFSSTKSTMDFDWCVQPELGLLSPDMVLYLDVKPDVAKSRGQYGNEIYEDPETQSRVRGIYKKFMTDKWKVIDANKSVAEVHSDLVNIVENFDVGNDLLVPQTSL